MSRTCTTACAALRPMPMPRSWSSWPTAGASCTVGRADVAAVAREAGLSLEEAARQARYRFLIEVAEAGGASTLAVGYNADDQAETVLMHFLRGSGAAGLRGMLPRTALDEYRLSQAVSDGGQRRRADGNMGQVANLSYEVDLRSKCPRHVRRQRVRRFPRNGAVRIGICVHLRHRDGSTVTRGDPLVRSADPRVPASPRLLLVRPRPSIPRAEIEAYCADYRLAPRTDRSNEDTTFFRDRLRHELLPLLENLQPGHP